jgi:hypothetical protein
MMKTKKAARSVETPGSPKSNPSGLPYGAGSMQIRGRMWWIIYRDTEGRVIQENSKTEDADVARRLLIGRALDTARAKVVALEGLLDETPKEKRDAVTRRLQAGKRAKHERGVEALRGDVAGSGNDTSAKARGGKA